jgi:hypothetical protein
MGGRGMVKEEVEGKLTLHRPALALGIAAQIVPHLAAYRRE